MKSVKVRGKGIRRTRAGETTLPLCRGQFPLMTEEDRVLSELSCNHNAFDIWPSAHLPGEFEEFYGSRDWQSKYSHVQGEGSTSRAIGLEAQVRWLIHSTSDKFRETGDSDSPKYTAHQLALVPWLAYVPRPHRLHR